MKKTVILLALVAWAAGARAQFATGQPASSVLGQRAFTGGAINCIDGAGFQNPSAVAIDAATGKVFVADANNHRVLRFASAQALLTGGVAEAVFGQPDMFSNVLNNGGPSNGMSGPSGVALDASGNLYVADQFNNRVLRFANAATAPSGANASAALGQADLTSTLPSTTQAGMQNPSAVALDASGNLYVADQFNNRVLRFANAATAPSGANASAALGQANFTSSAPATTQSRMNNPAGVAVDASGNLYVADVGNSRVLRFANAASALNGANASAVLGQANFTSSAPATTQSRMNNPAGVAVDASGNLYVADEGNNRVLRFANAASAPNGADASAVLGQANFLSNSRAAAADRMYFPRGMAIDASGNLYVADRLNHRVLRFANAASAPNGASAVSVLGQSVFTTDIPNGIDSSGFNAPFSVAVDASTSKVFVADRFNHRVLRFASAQALLTGGVAEAVFGQPDLFSNAANNGGISASRMNQPTGVAVDASGNLYVADAGNNRVLRFANAATALSGAAASAVFGQTNSTNSSPATSQSGMSRPIGVAVAAGNLYVADSSNNRVLRFANAATALTGANASVVLGQADFTSNGFATTQSGMNGPTGVAVDASGNLYVADQLNHRVLRFANAATAPTGANASLVLGQPNFLSSAEATTSNRMSRPAGVAVDASGNLYVADQFNSRVLRFNNGAIFTFADASIVLGQATFNIGTANAGGISASRMNQPTGIAVDASGNLYVADRLNHRVLRFTGLPTFNASPASITSGVYNDVTFTTSGSLPASVSVTIFGTLTLNAGVTVDLNGCTLTVANSASSAVAGTGFLTGSGSLTRAFSGNQTYAFPYAQAGNNRTASVQFTAGTGTGNLTYSFFNAPPGTAGLPLTFLSQTINATAPFFWRIDATGSPGTYTLSLSAENVGGVNAVAPLRIVKRPNGGSFSTAGIGTGNANTGTTAFPVVVQSGMFGFSEFTIGGNSSVNQLPVELVEFTGRKTSEGVHLAWRTASELNNSGFEVERKSQGGNWNTLGFVRGNGTTTEAQSYSFLDRTASGKVQYRLKQLDFDGQFEYSPIVEVDAGLPKTFELSQNYPNPFNPTTVISYQLPVASNVSLKVYDVLGKEVMTLVNGRQEAGQYNASVNANSLASGVYFYRLQAGNFVSTKKMMLVK